MNAHPQRQNRVLTQAALVLRDVAAEETLLDMLARREIEPHEFQRRMKEIEDERVPQR